MAPIPRPAARFLTSVDGFEGGGLSSLRPVGVRLYPARGFTQGTDVLGTTNEANKEELIDENDFVPDNREDDSYDASSRRRGRKRGEHMIDWSTCPAVEQVPGKVSGAWIFTNTRVPLSHLFANLEAGATIEEFLDWFEGVEDWQVRAVLTHLESSLLQDLKHETAV